jgi:hypothetical protein
MFFPTKKKLVVCPELGIKEDASELRNEMQQKAALVQKHLTPQFWVGRGRVVFGTEAHGKAAAVGAGEGGHHHCPAQKTN